MTENKILLSLKISEITKEFNQKFSQAISEIQRIETLKQYHQDVDRITKEFNSK